MNEITCPSPLVNSESIDECNHAYLISISLQPSPRAPILLQATATPSIRPKGKKMVIDFLGRAGHPFSTNHYSQIFINHFGIHAVKYYQQNTFQGIFNNV